MKQDRITTNGLKHPSLSALCSVKFLDEGTYTFSKSEIEFDTWQGHHIIRFKKRIDNTLTILEMLERSFVRDFFKGDVPTQDLMMELAESWMQSTSVSFTLNYEEKELKGRKFTCPRLTNVSLMTIKEA